MIDSNAETIQQVAQVAMWGGIVSATVVAALVAYKLAINSHDHAEREETLLRGVKVGFPALLLIAAPALVEVFIGPDNHGGAASTDPADATSMDWTPGLSGLSGLWMLLSALAFAGLTVAAVKAGKKINRRRKVRQAADAKVAGAQAQEHEHWQNAVRRHDVLRAQYYALETDPMARLTMPAFWDFTRPLSTAWWDAQGAADNRRTEQVPVDPAWRHEYADTVDRAARAFAAARDDARRVGLSTMDHSERRRVERAQRALRTVLDDASTEAERRIAYRVVLDSIAGIVDLPPVMRHQLTARTGRELTAAERIGQRPQPA